MSAEQDKSMPSLKAEEFVASDPRHGRLISELIATSSRYCVEIGHGGYAYPPGFVSKILEHCSIEGFTSWIGYEFKPSAAASGKRNAALLWESLQAVPTHPCYFVQGLADYRAVENAAVIVLRNPVDRDVPISARWLKLGATVIVVSDYGGEVSNLALRMPRSGFDIATEDFRQFGTIPNMPNAFSDTHFLVYEVGRGARR